MITLYSNLGLLDHAIERCLLDNQVKNLLVYIPKLTQNISTDITSKMERLDGRLVTQIIVRKNIIIDSWAIYKALRSSKVIYFDDLSGKDVLSIILLVKKKKFLFLHDVNPHLGESRIFSRVKRVFYGSFRKIFLCSEFSFNEFTNSYKRLTSRAELSPLPVYNYMLYGITQPKVAIPSRYLLIFGRVSPYKGIKEFISLYDHKIPVMIVGKGENIVHRNVLHINDFVPVAELNYYIINAEAIVVPYLEATQSGVLSVLRGYDGVKVFIRDIAPFKGETMLPNWVRYNDGILNDVLDLK